MTAASRFWDPDRGALHLAFADPSRTVRDRYCERIYADAQTAGAAVWTSSPALYRYWSPDRRNLTLAWHTGTNRLLWQVARTEISRRADHAARTGQTCLQPCTDYPLLVVITDDYDALADPRNDQAVATIASCGRSHAVSFVIAVPGRLPFSVMTSHMQGMFAWAGTRDLVPRATETGPS